MHKTVEQVTRRIIDRSKETRTAYLKQIEAAARKQAEGKRGNRPGGNSHRHELRQKLYGCHSR